MLPQPLAGELLAAPLIAYLGTFNEDATIHLVPVWFLWDGEALLVPTAGSSRKARNLARDPRATVMLHDSRGGVDVRGITLVGRATIVRGEEAASLNELIHLKYVTARGLGLAAVHLFLAADDVTLRFVPESATSWDETQTDAARDLRESGEFAPPFLS
jgi:PPOX class probable F420-dependent enzyme